MFMLVVMIMMEVDEAATIKLFGAVIVTKQVDEEKETPLPPREEEVAAAKEAAASAAALQCPRCRSSETKFCYFNNYNVNQPRHFCKACHRYWTAGGTLRNVPVGAGRRRGHLGPDHTAASVLGYPAPPYVLSKWLLRPQPPARVDHGRDGTFDAGLC